MKTQMTITMDSELKEQFKQFAKKAGTNVSNLISMMASNLVQTQKIEFDFSDNSLDKIRTEALDDLKNNKNIYSREDFKSHFKLN